MRFVDQPSLGISADEAPQQLLVRVIQPDSGPVELERGPSVLEDFSDALMKPGAAGDHLVDLVDRLEKPDLAAQGLLQLLGILDPPGVRDGDGGLLREGGEGDDLKWPDFSPAPPVVNGEQPENV